MKGAWKQWLLGAILATGLGVVVGFRLLKGNLTGESGRVELVRGSKGSVLGKSKRSVLGELVPLDQTVSTVEAASAVHDSDLSTVVTGLSREILDTEFARSLVRRWVALDASAAVGWAFAVEATFPEVGALQTALGAWANLDLAGSKFWMEQLPSGIRRQQAVQIIAIEAIRSQPKEALRLAQELVEGQGRNDLLVQASGEWALTDPQGAYDWVAQFPVGPLKDKLVVSVASALADLDGVSAADFAAEELPPGPDQDRAVVSVVQRWAQKEPGQAAAWVLQFPEGDLKVAAVQNLVELWMKSAPKEAAHWISGLGDSPTHDQALQIFINRQSGFQTPSVRSSYAPEFFIQKPDQESQ